MTIAFNGKVYEILNETDCITTPKGSFRFYLIQDGNLAWGKNAVNYGVVAKIQRDGGNWSDLNMRLTLHKGPEGLVTAKAEFEKFVGEAKSL